jgi:hypothetical protein
MNPAAPLTTEGPVHGKRPHPQRYADRPCRARRVGTAARSQAAVSAQRALQALRAWRICEVTVACSDSLPVRTFDLIESWRRPPVVPLGGLRRPRARATHKTPHQPRRHHLRRKPDSHAVCSGTKARWRSSYLLVCTSIANPHTVRRGRRQVDVRLPSLAKPASPDAPVLPPKRCQHAPHLSLRAGADSAAGSQIQPCRAWQPRASAKTASISPARSHRRSRLARTAS